MVRTTPEGWTLLARGEAKRNPWKRTTKDLLALKRALLFHAQHVRPYGAMVPKESMRTRGSASLHPWL